MLGHGKARNGVVELPDSNRRPPGYDRHPLRERWGCHWRAGPRWPGICGRVRRYPLRSACGPADAASRLGSTEDGAHGRRPPVCATVGGRRLTRVEVAGDLAEALALHERGNRIDLARLDDVVDAIFRMLERDEVSDLDGQR